MRLWLILIVVGTAFWVYSIVDCALQPATRHRGVSKPAWIVIVALLPVLGGVLWFVVGRGRPSRASGRRAPDDDPEFLGRISLGSISDQDERIRRLEEELAQLDAEADDPRPPERPARDTPGAASADPSADGDDDARGHRGAVG